MKEQALSEADAASRRSVTARSSLATMALVVASTSFNAVTADAIVSAMPQMSKEFGTGGQAAFLVQMILVAPSISIIVGAPLAGYIVRLVGMRALMLPALVLYALAGGYGYIAADSVSLIGSRVILGFVSGLLGAASLARAAEFDTPVQNRLLGFANAMAATTAIGSFVLGGWLAAAFGWRTANLAYLWSLAVIPLVILSSPKASPDDANEDSTARTGFPWIATLPVYLLSLMVFMIVYGPSIQGPFVLAQRGMIDPAEIGIAISAPAFTCVLAGAAYGTLARLLSRGMQYVTFFALFLASTAITAFSSGLTFTVIGLSITGFGSGILSPLLLSTLLRKVPRRHIATAAGLFASATYVGVFFAPPTYRLITTVTPLSVFEGLAVGSAIGLALSLLLMMTGRIRA